MRSYTVDVRGLLLPVGVEASARNNRDDQNPPPVTPPNAAEGHTDEQVSTESPRSVVRTDAADGAAIVWAELAERELFARELREWIPMSQEDRHAQMIQCAEKRESEILQCAEQREISLECQVSKLADTLKRCQLDVGEHLKVFFDQSTVLEGTVVQQAAALDQRCADAESFHAEVEKLRSEVANANRKLESAEPALAWKERAARQTEEMQLAMLNSERTERLRLEAVRRQLETELETAKTLGLESTSRAGAASATALIRYSEVEMRMHMESEIADSRRSVALLRAELATEKALKPTSGGCNGTRPNQKVSEQHQDLSRSVQWPPVVQWPSDRFVHESRGRPNAADASVNSVRFHDLAPTPYRSDRVGQADPGPERSPINLKCQPVDSLGHRQVDTPPHSEDPYNEHKTPLTESLERVAGRLEGLHSRLKGLRPASRLGSAALNTSTGS